MTRKRPENNEAGIAQEKFMSAPEFREIRAIPGNLVAAKTQLYPERRHRELLLWLQAVSNRPGGIKQLARDLVKEFPDRLGCRTMHAKGTKGNISYTDKEAGMIIEELGQENVYRHGDGEVQDFIEIHSASGFYDIESADPDRHKPKPLENEAAGLLRLCKHMSADLPEFLRELCLDPDIDLEALEVDCWHQRVPYFHDLWSALQAFKRRDETPDEKDVITSIGGLVNGTLNHALTTRRMVAVEGVAGIGKSHAVKAWCRLHPAQVRYISLSGIMTRTGLFQKIAEAIGLATCQRKALELQAKIENFFAITGMMLVIDEAHYLWPQTMRIASAPELVDWVNTALVNVGAPVALICTNQFARLKERCERQTGWTSEQLTHRIKRYTKLPETPTEADLRSVTRQLLPMMWDDSSEGWISQLRSKPDSDAVKLIVGYALSARQPMSAVRDAVDEARDIARLANRVFVDYDDVKTALLDRQIPSDAAMKKAFELEPRGKRRGVSNLATPAIKKESRIRLNEYPPDPGQRIEPSIHEPCDSDSFNLIARRGFDLVPVSGK